MTDFTFECDIPVVNGKAEGTLTVRRADGRPIIRDSGNWLSDFKQRAVCKVVATDYFPEPKRVKGEAAKAFAKRRDEWREKWEAVAAEAKRKLLHALDQIEGDTEAAELSAAANAPQPQEQPPDARPVEYAATDHGIVRMKRTPDGAVAVPLTNFTAYITANVVRDDGAERQSEFEIAGTLHGRHYTFTVPAQRFTSMDWPIEHMGPNAIVYAGQGNRDHARAAVQLLSDEPTRRTVFCHTGWRDVEGETVYLHAGGAIGKDGAVAGVEVDLSGALCGYALPEPPTGEQLKQCVRASLGLFTAGAAAVVAPGICAVHRAAVATCDASLYYVGPTGVFKSEWAALLQQHFGAGMDARHLPGSWSSTDNALEGLAFAAKDALLVVDDFAPGGSSHDVQRFHAKADRVIRAQGNHSGRQRMRPDGTLRPNRPPRGLIVATGEDVPRGQSLRARMLVVEMGPGDIDTRRLTECQAEARDGLYAGAMSGFIRWLAWRVCRVQGGLREAVADLRRSAEASASHRRTPDVVANLAAGLMHFLEFARDVDAVTESESASLWAGAWDALGKAAARQAAHQAASEPAARFLELLASAIASGNAHLTGVDGGTPDGAEAWGWCQQSIGTGAYARDDWQPRGERVGWVEGDSVYLDPDAGYKAAQAMAAGGEGIVVSAQTLRKRLHERGLLIREGKRDELTVRRVLSGSTRRVLLLKPGCLISGKPAKPAIPATAPDSDPENGGFLADALAGFTRTPTETRHQNPPSEAAGATENGDAGGSGGNGGSSAHERPPSFSNPRWTAEDDAEALRLLAEANAREAWAGATRVATGDGGRA